MPTRKGGGNGGRGSAHPVSGKQRLLRTLGRSPSAAAFFYAKFMKGAPTLNKDHNNGGARAGVSAVPPARREAATPGQLKLTIQRSGRLTEETLSLLHGAGL